MDKRIEELSRYAVEQEQLLQPKEYTGGEVLKGLFAENLTGVSYLLNTSGLLDIDDDTKEQMDSDTVLSILGSYKNIPVSDYEDIIGKSNNYRQLSDYAQYRSKQQEDIEAIYSMGTAGAIGSSLAVGLLDIPSWIIGAGAGKLAYSSYKAGVGYRTSQTLAAGSAGLASAYTVEASKDRDLSLEGGATTFAIGALLGYGFSSKNIPAEHAISIAKTTQSLANNREALALKFMASPADRMRASYNQSDVDVADMIAPSQTIREANLRQTARDIKMKIQQQYINTTVKEIDNFIKTEFVNIAGRKYNKQDDVTVNYYGHQAEFKYTSIRDDKFNDIISGYKTNIDNELKELDNLLIKDNADISGVTSKYDSDISALRTKLEAETQQKKIDTLNKRIQKLEDAKAKEVAAIQKEVFATGRKSKDYIQAKKDIETKYKKLAKQESREYAKAQVDNILNEIPKQYREIVKMIVAGKGRVGEYMNKLKLNGKDDLDTSFYWSKELDISKISADPDGAREAFRDAILDNFDKADITDELIAKIDEKAIKMVNSLVNRDLQIQPLEVDRDIFTDIDAVLKPSYLKGRKIKYNGARMIDYMKDGVVESLESYGDRLSGKIAVKEALGIDDLYTATKFANDMRLSQEGATNFNEALKGLYGTRTQSPNQNSIASRIVDTLQNINFGTLGGWFGATALSDLAVVANKMGTGRSLKYFSDEIVSPLSKTDAGIKFADYLGTAIESVMGNRAMLFGASRRGADRTAIERGASQLAKGMAKWSGMNMVVDAMDRTAGLVTLDFIQTANMAKNSSRKTFNQLGLSKDDVDAIRQSKAIVMKNGKVVDFKPELMSEDLLAKFNMGVRRAIDSTVLKHNELDMPTWALNLFSPEVSKILFPFMAFPIKAYGIIQRGTYHNFDAMNFAGATAIGLALLGLTTQLREIGKEDKKFDLSTEKGQIEVLKFALDRNPIVPSLGIANQYFGILDKMQNQVTGDTSGRYQEAYGNLGITPQRLYNLHRAFSNFITGEETARDAIAIKSLLLPNLVWYQPINNMFTDKIKEQY